MSAAPEPPSAPGAADPIAAAALHAELRLFRQQVWPEVQALGVRLSEGVERHGATVAAVGAQVLAASSNAALLAAAINRLCDVAERSPGLGSIVGAMGRAVASWAAKTAPNIPPRPPGPGGAP